MGQTKFEKAMALIDTKNAEDIHIESYQGKEFPKELLYSNRMSKKLLLFQPNASEALEIAARAQHICRWEIERNAYPMNRIGYLKWREELKKMHANITTGIVRTVGYESEFTNRVAFLISKKIIKKDADSQTLEDVVCLVFLEYYFEVFAAKHNNEKVIDILQKTWKKMSEKGQNEALKLTFSSHISALIKQALE